MLETHRYNSWFMTVTVFSAALMIVLAAVSALMLMLPGAGRFPCVIARHRSECEALVAIYDSMGGEEWEKSHDWLSTLDVCDWYGIRCTQDRHVSRIDLLLNNVSGSLPPEIGELRNLLVLSMSNNELKSLPPEIGNLQNLQSLDLSDNTLESLPLEIGDLSNLQWLILSNNVLTSLPPEIGGLSNLVGLYASGNELECLPPEIRNPSKLETLQLDCDVYRYWPPECTILLRTIRVVCVE